MKLRNLQFRLANWLFKNHFAAYDLLYGCWKLYADRHERRQFRKLIKPGMIVMDVGANIGVHTRYFSKLTGRSGRVYAFEPSPENFRHLLDNTKHLKNVILSNTAVGERCGTTKLFKSNELNVDHRTFDSSDGRHSIDVPLISLDSYFPQGQRVDFIKIDVQGFELSVVKGAQRIFTENWDIKVLMEFWPYGLEKASEVPADLLQFFADLGFSIFNVFGKDLMQTDLLNLKVSSAGDYSNVVISRSLI